MAALVAAGAIAAVGCGVAVGSLVATGTEVTVGAEVAVDTGVSVGAGVTVYSGFTDGEADFVGVVLSEVPVPHAHRADIHINTIPVSIFVFIVSLLLTSVKHIPSQDISYPKIPGSDIANPHVYIADITIFINDNPAVSIKNKTPSYAEGVLLKFVDRLAAVILVFRSSS